MIKKQMILFFGIILISFILFVSAQQINETTNENETIMTNITENLTMEDNFNESLQNETENIILISNLSNNLTGINDTLNNLTLINDTLIELLDNLSTIQYTNGSYCYFVEDSVDYNMTINGTNETKTLNLSISLCYNETTVYCFSNNSVPTTLYRIDVEEYACKNGYCMGSEIISNPYDISDRNFNNATSFICFDKIKQDGYHLWLWKAINLYEDGNIFYFDFSNSSFFSYDYVITNTTVYNIINNITNGIANNITNNFTYFYNITNNITANLSEIEARITILEEWRIYVDKTIDYILGILVKLADFFEKHVFFLDFSNSQFVENNYNITDETVYNITNNITNDILNTITNNNTYVYNITNNILAENLTGLETRVSVLESWKEQVNKTLEYIVNKLNEFFDRIKNLWGDNQ